MKKTIAAFALAVPLALTFSDTFAKPTMSESEGFREYIQSLTTFLPTIKQQAPSIWPGFQIKNIPLVVKAFSFYVADDSLYALNLTTQNPAWQKQLINNTTVHYMPHDEIGAYSFDSSELNPYFIVDNQPTLLTEYVDFSESERGAKAINTNQQILALNYYMYYELFDSPFAKQKMNLFLQAKYGSYDSFLKPDLYALLLLEAKALEQYLQTQDEDALKNYSAIFSYRYRMLNDTSKVNETAFEPLCMDYVAYKATSRNENEFVAAIKNMYHFLPSTYSEATFYDDFNHVMRYTQAAVTYGLDHVDPTWKSIVETTNIVPSLLLEKKYHFSEQEISSRVVAAKRQYGYEKMLADVNNLLMPYLANTKILQDQYDKNSGAEFVLNISDLSSYGTSYDKKYYVDSNTVITQAISIGTKSMDGTTFNGRNIKPLYFTNYENDFAQATLRFKLPSSAKIIVDGAEDNLQHFLAQDKQVSFHHLSIIDGSFSADISTNSSDYKLTVVNGKPKVQKISANLQGEKQVPNLQLFKNRFHSMLNMQKPNALNSSSSR